MIPLSEAADNIEAKHSAEHDSYDMCDCFDRLLAAVRGEPDPNGEAYRWPVYRYGCEEAPQFGPETVEDAMVRSIHAVTVEAYSQDLSLLAHVGLSERLTSMVINPPVIITKWESP